MCSSVQKQDCWRLENEPTRAAPRAQALAVHNIGGLRLWAYSSCNSLPRIDLCTWTKSPNRRPPANHIGGLGGLARGMAALVHRSPTARAGDLWRFMALGAMHRAALCGTGLQRAAPPGTSCPSSEMSAVVQGRPPNALAVFGDLAIKEAGARGPFRLPHSM
jgi:hypothetical protein